jgi:acetyltransferase
VGDLIKMFNPRTIALVGATGKEGSVGQRLLKNLLASPKERLIFPVNPNSKIVLGLACYPAMTDVPEHINLAIIATPSQTVPAVLEDCGKAHVDGVIIVSSGFRETGTEGLKLEDRILDINSRYHMRILGPNSLGLMRPDIGLNATPLKKTPNRGHVAFIAHTGGFGKTLIDWGISAHTGFSMVTSLGSALDIDFGDLIDYLGDDPHTHSIIIYMEEIVGDIKKFTSAVRGFARNKPVVVLKPPSVTQEIPEGLTHTGILANSEEVYDAVFKRLGVVRVQEAQDLFNATTALYSKHHPQGSRLAIITNASGVGAMATHRLIKSGGRLATLSPKTVQALEKLLPPYWNKSNPVNLHADADINRYGHTIDACLSDPEVDGLLVIFTPQEAARTDELSQALIEIARNSWKPLLTAWFGGEDARLGRETLSKHGIPSYETAEEAVRTYLYMYSYERNLQLLHETPEELPVDEAPPKNHLKTLMKKDCREAVPILTEEDAKKFLTNYGIPTIRTETASTLEEARQYANEMGYPVVLKIVSPDIIFRQDVGGVLTGIKSDSALKEEYENLISRVKQLAPHAEIRGVTIQKMIEIIDYELILGVKKDKNFGSVILFGMGGSGVQLFKDFSVGLPPLNQTLARRLMEETEVYKMLQGYRGKHPADLRQLEKIIVSFSNLIIDFPEIMEMDIHPIAVTHGKAYALNARIALDRQCFLLSSMTFPHLIISPYPTRYISHWRLSDNTDVLLRPIRPEDEPLEHEMLTTLSEETLRGRYYQTLKNISHKMHVQSCNIDYDREMAIVAEIRESGKRKIIGNGRLIIESDFTKGEFGVLVHDNYQGKGLAHKLLDVLIGIADEKGLKEFYGIIQANNRKMLRIADRLGMFREPYNGELVRVKLLLR